MPVRWETWNVFLQFIDPAADVPAQVAVLLIAAGVRTAAVRRA